MCVCVCVWLGVCGMRACGWLGVGGCVRYVGAHGATHRVRGGGCTWPDAERWQHQVVGGGTLFLPSAGLF